jgi:hypothetical protein
MTAASPRALWIVCITVLTSSVAAAQAPSASATRSATVSGGVSSPEARPWSGETAVRVYGVGAVGAGGEVNARGSGLRTRADAVPSGGAALGVEIPLAHAFSIGAEGNFWTWGTPRSDAMAVSDSFVLEVSAVPRFRCPWTAPSGEQHFALGLALPVGPTLSFLNSGDQTNTLSSLGTRDGRGWGVHAGALAEAQVFLIPRVGLLLDVGYIHHVFWHDAITAGDRALQIDFGQVVVRFGLVVAL